MKAIDIDVLLHLSGESRYEVNRAFATAHDRVVTPWNRMTIPCRYALPTGRRYLARAGAEAVSCTAANAHFTPSN